MKHNKRTTIVSVILLSILLIVLFFYFKSNQIIETYPASNATAPDTTTEIRVTLKYPIFPFTSSEYALETIPPTQPSKFTVKNNTQLIFTYQEPLPQGYIYHASLKRRNAVIYSWNFTIPGVEEDKIQVQMEQQKIKDEEVGTFFKGYYEENPFAKNFPIDNENFFIIYSSKTKEFIVLIKHTGEISELTNTYKQQAFTLLQSADVNLQQADIVWKSL